MTDETKLRNYEKIMNALRGVRGREEGVHLRRGLFFTLVTVIGIVIGAALLEAVFRFGIDGRTLLFSLTGIGILAAAAAFVVPPLMRRFSEHRRKSEDTVALEVGSYFPYIKDRLLNAMQVFREMRREKHAAYSPVLVDAGFRDVADAFDRLDLTPVVDTTPAKRAGRSALFSILIGAVLFAMMPGTLGGALHRIVSFRTDFAPPAPFDFIVEPGDREAVKGEELRLTATTTAEKQPEITFHLREQGQEEFDAVVTTLDSSGAYVHSIPSIRGSIVYYAEAAGYRSRQYAVDVVDRPFVRSLRVRLTYPSYTKLPPRYLDDNVGDVTALAGTRISLDLAFNKDVAEAAIVFNDSQRVSIEHEDARAQTSFPLTKDASWHVALEDESGIANANPIEYTLKVVPDMVPVIDVLEPGMNTDLDESMRLPLISRISDDYGFTKMVLKYRLAASRYEKPHEEYSSIIIPLPTARELEMEVPYIWNLTSMSLVPEDVVNYYIEIYDNDVVNGPKVGRSQVFSLRLPSLEEVFARADNEQEKAIENLEETLKAAQDVQRELDKLQQEMKQQNAEKLDWQQQKKMEELMKRQEQMLKDVEKVNEQMNRLKEDMQKQNMISEETLRKYEELDQLMKEVDAPELQKARKRMEEMMREMSPEQMKQAMENFEFNEENFRRSIERTIDLLKRIQIEQKVDEITKRADELAKKQEDLAERTENADPQNQDALDKLAEEQRQLQKEMEAMQREMAELQKKMEEFPQEMPLDEMQQAQNELNEANMNQSMSQSASQCQGGNCQSASKSMKKTAQKMRQFQKRMENVKKKMQQQMQKMVQRAFQKALKEVLEMSKQQEELKNQVQKLPVNSPQYREATREQMRLMEQLNQTGNELMELAKKTFAVNPQMAQHLGKAMKKMQEALKSMQNRDQRSGGQQQGGAMAELNEAAKQLAKGLQKSSQGGSSQGGSLLQQLRQMAKQQMDINANMPTPTDGQMSMRERQQLKRMMQQQAAMQKSLQELNEEAKRSDEGRRLTGDLERIAEEMQEVVRDMQQENVNPNTMQKQERILSRLLDASRSMRERDWEKRRRSRTGEDVARSSPSALDENALDPQEGLRYDLQKAVNEGYARDYEVLIRKYFEGLEEVMQQ